MNSTNGAYEIGRVESEKYICVTFDRPFEFDIHINEKINKPSSICAMIRRTYKLLNMKTVIPMCEAIARRHLEF